MAALLPRGGGRPLVTAVTKRPPSCTPGGWRRAPGRSWWRTRGSRAQSCECPRARRSRGRRPTSCRGRGRRGTPGRAGSARTATPMLPAPAPRQGRPPHLPAPRPRARTRRGCGQPRGPTPARRCRPRRRSGGRRPSSWARSGHSPGPRTGPAPERRSCPPPWSCLAPTSWRSRARAAAPTGRSPRRCGERSSRGWRGGRRPRCRSPPAGAWRRPGPPPRRGRRRAPCRTRWEGGRPRARRGPR
mmetsp:Transcript_106977/g.303140  ORF Transcript_106977/g.303140 Transcript_106977/m.303140 type:complete len:244 (+) Transcript_106977:2712-3443(+)